jgi:hypothetical protein
LYREVLADASFHRLLLAVDEDLAADRRAAGCPCGGALHSAKFRRKPRGKPLGLAEAFDLRFSFCCAVRDCRQRATPPSMRFLGGKVYLATAVILLSVLQQGETPARLERLSTALGGVDRRTLARWRSWWRSDFAQSPFWRGASAAFMPPADDHRLPSTLLERFGGETRERLLALLRWLGPITAGPSMRRAF